MKINYQHINKISLFDIIILLFFLSTANYASSQTFAIPPKFDYAGNFSEGLASVTLNGNKFFIDKTGRKILSLPKKYETVYDFSEGYARVISNGKFGFIDRDGNVIIDFKFGNASDFINGFSIVSFDKISLSNMFSDDNKSGVINKKGDFIINPYLTKIFDFNDGYAVVNFGGLFNPVIGVIDTNGNTVISGKFEYINKFNEGLAGALTQDGNPPLLQGS